MKKLELSCNNGIPMNAIKLKNILMEIKSGGRTWEEENKESKDYIVKSMIEHIGTTDSELRDNLIYSSFCQLIAEKNQVELDLLDELLELCLSDLLFKGIGENGTDTVFTRSFTTLLIALILYRDNEDNFISQNMMLRIKDKLIDYINLEKDLRGYISVKGWAHSIAHVTDAIKQLVNSSKIDCEYYSEILKVLWSKVLVSTSVYIHNEDERILIPILEMIKNGLKQAEVETLIQHIPVELKTQKELIEGEEYWFLYSNCKTFLKSFYIKINTNRELIPLKKSIEKCLIEISL